MWNKLEVLMQDPSHKRLALALCASILLHAMMFGGVDLSLPYFKKEMHVIEARIQMPKATVKQVEPAKLEPEVVMPKAEKSIEPPPQPVIPPKVEETADAPTQEVAETNNPEPAPEVVPPVESSTPSQVPEKIEPEPAQEPQPVDAGLVINENAYQYVETYFDVSTKIDGPTEGKAKAIFNVVDNDHYQLNFLVKAEGLAALILPDLLQTSDGLLTKTGLRPLNYLYQFGKKTDKTRKAVFDWQTNTVQLTNGNEVKTEALLEDTQDVLSFMYQFMYVPPLQKMQLNITNGKKIREYDYGFEGEENVNSTLGEVKTIHIVHTGVEVDERIELWLAIDYQYIPVKIRKIDKDGKIYEFVATRVITTRPTIDGSQPVK